VVAAPSGAVELALAVRRGGRRVGVVALGRHPRGPVAVGWSLAVGGRRLAPGRYRVQLVARHRSRTVARSRWITISVPRAPRGGPR
jgi:hypothetical protein